MQNEHKDLDTAASRSGVISQHVLIHLLIKKGIFTKTEYEEVFDWFNAEFTMLANKAHEAARQSVPIDIVQSDIRDQIIRIQKKLYNIED